MLLSLIYLAIAVAAILAVYTVITQLRQHAADYRQLKSEARRLETTGELGPRLQEAVALGSAMEESTRAEIQALKEAAVVDRDAALRLRTLLDKELAFRRRIADEIDRSSHLLKDLEYLQTEREWCERLLSQQDRH